MVTQQVFGVVIEDSAIVFGSYADQLGSSTECTTCSPKVSKEVGSLFESIQITTYVQT